MKNANVPAIVVTGVVSAIVLIASGVAWWLNERAVMLEGDVVLMPRSEIVRAEKILRPAAEIFNYTCRTRHTAAQAASFYRTFLGNAGWRIVEEAGGAFQFERDESVFRLVLHPQRFRTVFTLYIRHPYTVE